MLGEPLLTGESMSRTFLVVPLLLLPAFAGADPVELDADDIGPRWAGVNFHDNFGWSVETPGDLDGDGVDDFLVASPQDDGPVTFDSSVRVYLGRSGRLPQQRLADWNAGTFTDAGNTDDSVFRFSVIDDATGDGLRDLLTAEPNAGTSGLVLLYPGDGDWTAAQTTINSAYTWTGYTQTEFPQLATETRPSDVVAGDFDGDGLSDVAIASVLFNRVWIDYSADGFQAETSLQDITDVYFSCVGDFPGAGYGSDIAVGDFNDDGLDDLVVGAPGCNGEDGLVEVFYGANGGFGVQADLTIEGDERLGNRVHVADLNGDGIDDLLIQELQRGTDENNGGLWIHPGSASGLSAEPITKIVAGFSDQRLGASVAVLPDISNPPDGLPELVVGSPEASISGVGQGTVYIFEGRDPWPATLAVADARYRIDGSQLNAWFGQSLGTVGDFDDDGYPDFLIGEPNYSGDNSENEFHRGRVYLFTALPDRDEDNDGFSTLNGDCDDTDPAVRPGLAEECNGYDDDCDHEVDEGCDGDDDDSAGDDDDTVGDDDDDEGGCDCGSSMVPAEGSGGLLALALLGGLAIRRRR